MINDNNGKNEQITALENFVKHHMTKQAISRYSNVKLAHPNTALNALIILFQIAQQGTIIDDNKLKQILESIRTQNTTNTNFNIE